MFSLGLRLTPQGHLVLEHGVDAPDLDEAIAGRLAEAFSQGSGPGLVQLGAGEVGKVLPPVFGWWRGFAGRYVAALCGQPASSFLPEIAAPDPAELENLVRAGPMMPGSEYLSPDVLRALWAEMAAAVSVALAAAKTDLQAFLRALNPAWNLVGRVHFNLAENRGGPGVRRSPSWRPTPRGSRPRPRRSTCRSARPCANTPGRPTATKLLALLLPVQRAAETCDWLKPMVDAGEIFHPLRWTPGGRRALADQRAGAGGGRRRGAHAGHLACRTARRGRR